MNKSDFVWTVGYQGNTAIINKKMKSSIRTLDPAKLLEEGHVRPAFCAALWDAQEKPETMAAFIQAFNAATGLSLALDDLKRLVGVYQIPEESIKTLAI